MQESKSVNPVVLTDGQLSVLARKTSVFAGKSFIDVGCGQGTWLLQQRRSGHKICGMDEKQALAQPVGEGISAGSPAAAVPWEPHSVDRILFRGTSAFHAPEFSPERMIALANLGSTLKARGCLLIPLCAATPLERELEAQAWQNQLTAFPGRVRTRTLSAGWRAIVSLAFLFGRNDQITVLEFNVGNELTSRLEWHQLARTAVMQHQAKQAAA